MARKQWWLALLLFGVTLLAYWPSLHGAFLWNDSDYVTARALRSWRGLWRIWFEVGAVQQYYPVLHTAFWIEHRLWGDSVLGYHLTNGLLHATAALLFGIVLRRLSSSTGESIRLGRGFGAQELRSPRAGASAKDGQPAEFSSKESLSAGLSPKARMPAEASPKEDPSAKPSAKADPPAEGLANPDSSVEALAKAEAPILPWAWFAAFVFALHPVCAESVAWISEEKNTLSTVFYLAAGLAFLRFDEARNAARARAGESAGGVGLPAGAALAKASARQAAGLAAGVSKSHCDGGNRGSPIVSYLVATGLFVLALLSKSVAATLPAALLIIIWWRRGRLYWRSDVGPLLPWFAIGAAVGLFTAWVEVRYIGAQGEVFRLSSWQRFLVAGRAIWFYLGKLIWPHPLIFIYPRWKVSASAGWQYLYPLSILALLAALWAWRRHSRAPLASALFFIGSLFPVLGFFNVYAFNFSYVADHFQYLPSLGVIALLAGGGSWLLGRPSSAEDHPSTFSSDARAMPPGPGCRWPGTGGRWSLGARSLHALALVELLSLGALTWRQCDHYRDEPTFYRAILEKNPASSMAHNNLGVLLRRQGKTREAQAEYEEALRIRPDSAEAQNNLGLILADQSRLAEAIDRYRAAVAAAPRFLDARRNLANALLRSGRADQAFAQYEEALRLRDNDAHTWNDVGSALFALNRIPEAAEHFRTALRFDANYSEAHSNLGNALVKMGRMADGTAEYKAALQLDPENASARSGLGMALAQSGHIGEALEQFKAALRSQPDFEQARNNLGNVLLAMGRSGEAAAQFEAVLRRNPASAEANNNLGNVMFRTGRIAEAIARYEQALRIDPVYLESQINLGVALCRLGRVEEGISHFETALRIDPDSVQARKDLKRAEIMLRSRSPELDAAPSR